MKAVKVMVNKGGTGFRPLTKSTPPAVTRPRQMQRPQDKTVEPAPMQVETIAPVISQKKPRVCCYCRVSTLLDSQETSIEGQREHYESLIKGNPECVFYWGMGFVGMWGIKWLIAIVFDYRDFISSLTSHVTLWSSNILPDTTKITRVGTLNKNFMMLFEDQYIDIILACYVILIVAYAIKKRESIRGEQITTCLLLYIPVLIGIFWILFMASHSNVHTFFTYRTVAPCVLCVLCGLDLGDITRPEVC